MPLVQVFTSLSQSKVPANLGKLVATALSQTLTNKPIEYLCVHVATDQVIFSGSQSEENGPTVFIILRSIGSVSLEDNRKTVAVLTDLLGKQLSIAPTEVRIFFDDYSADMIGMDGQVCSDIFNKK